MKPRTKAPKGGQLDGELRSELGTYEKVGLFQWGKPPSAAVVGVKDKGVYQVVKAKGKWADHHRGETIQTQRHKPLEGATS